MNDRPAQPRRIVRHAWINVYREDFGDRFVWVNKTKEDADACAGPSRVACVKVVIDCEEGEGL